MIRKKILITIDWFLPGTLSGGPVRSYANLIEHLNEGFEFYIITRNTDYGLNRPYEDIIPNTWVKFNAYTSVYYISNETLNKKHLVQIVNKVNFDLGFINGIYSWYFSILPIILLKKSGKPIIVSARGMLNPQAFSVKGFKKRMFLKMAKWIGLYKKVIFHATNKEESNYIKFILGDKTKVSIAPNLPRKLNQQIQQKIGKNSPVRFVNIGRVSIEKGTLVMLSALKHIKKPIELDIYGPIYDKLYWKKCEKVISLLPKHIRANYKGSIDSDLVPKTISKYDFFVLLSEGENFGHAILEALSVGCPVIISNLTPWKNLESLQLGWDMDTSNTKIILNAFNEAINMPNEVYSQWSQAAFNHAKEFMENPDLLEQNKILFLNSINK